MKVGVGGLRTLRSRHDEHVPARRECGGVRLDRGSQPATHTIPHDGAAEATARGQPEARLAHVIGHEPRDEEGMHLALARSLEGREIALAAKHHGDAAHGLRMAAADGA